MIRVTLGDSALSYARRQLEGGLSLSKRLTVALPSMTLAWAFVNEGLTNEQIVNFGVGGIGGRSDSQLRLAEFIVEDLSGSPSRCAVFEDVVARQGDPVVQAQKLPHFTHHGEVYDYLAGQDHLVPAALELVLTAHSWRMVGLLTDCVHIPKSDLTDEDLDSLVSHARHMMMGAWDGEGVVIFSRP